MTEDQIDVLRALYEVEQAHHRAHRQAMWSTAADVAAAMDASHPRHGDATWVREKLQELWVSRRVLQVPLTEGSYELHDVVLRGRDTHGGVEERLAVEQN